MLKAAKMQRVRVIGIKDNVGTVLQELQDLGAIEIAQVKRDYLEQGKPLEYANEIAEQLTRIRGMKQALTPVDFKTLVSLDAKQAVEEAKKITIDHEIVALEGRIEGATGREKEIREEIRLLEQLKPLHVDFSKLDKQYLDYRLGIVGAEEYHRLISLVSSSTSFYEVVRAPLGKEFVVLFAVKKGEHITEALEKGKFSEIPLPDITSTAELEIVHKAAQLKELEAQKSAAQLEMKKISTQYWPKIAVLNEALKIELDRANASAKLGVTEMSFVLEGWVLEKKCDHTIQALHRKFPKLVVERLESKEGAPIEFENPKPATPFEFLVEFFGLPVYDEVEPAAILAMTFPIIYGMMVGDVGYGLMSVVIALVILSKFKSGILNSVGKLWALAAIPTVLFGFFFDEWFGFSFQNFVAFFGVHVNGTFLSLFGIGLVLHRLEDISQLIVFTVMVGVLHLALGFLIGFFNEWHHNKTHAIAKLGWIGVLVSGLLLVPNLLFNAPFIPLAFDQVLVGAILFVVCVILIVRADGIIGLFEIPGVAGNAMSYARIAAVGIVGVVIAEKIINDLLVNGILAHTNNPIIFILVLAFVILLHFVNTFLAMFESLIQGARLNLVEFYGKFFHGGGRKFAPFAAARVYTKARPHSGPHEGHAKLGE